jgi:LAO/AO transport system kinase
MAGPDPDAETLLDAARDGDRGALARLISIVERGGSAAHEVGRVAHARGGQGYTIGLTGAPGAGKSTLTSALVGQIRGTGATVGVLAVDPSSPFTGGAILGDRVRMGDHVLDEGVYIRSMATRGHLGGLALATPEAVRVLDAAALPWIVIETVGVGQVEVEVAGAADTTVVVVNPGWGDAVQANKAGLMEIADIFVINKADRDGTRETRRDLESMLALVGGSERPWCPPVVATVSTTGEGVAGLWAEIGRHRDHLSETGELATRRADRLADELRHILTARLLERVDALAGGEGFAHLRDDVVERRLDPWSAADRLLGGDRGIR